MQNYFRSIPGFSKVEVDFRTVDGYNYDGVWIISYKGYYGTIPPLVIDDTNLAGGKSEAKVTHKVLR